MSTWMQRTTSALGRADSLIPLVRRAGLVIGAQSIRSDVGDAQS
jgi:hypothetical protein